VTRLRWWLVGGVLASGGGLAWSAVHAPSATHTSSAAPGGLARPAAVRPARAAQSLLPEDRGPEDVPARGDGAAVAGAGTLAPVPPLAPAPRPPGTAQPRGQPAWLPRPSERAAAPVRPRERPVPPLFRKASAAVRPPPASARADAGAPSAAPPVRVLPGTAPWLRPAALRPRAAPEAAPRPRAAAAAPGEAPDAGTPDG
jgi:hypothetical protein